MELHKYKQKWFFIATFLILYLKNVSPTVVLVQLKDFEGNSSSKIANGKVHHFNTFLDMTGFDLPNIGINFQ